MFPAVIVGLRAGMLTIVCGGNAGTTFSLILVQLIYLDRDVTYILRHNIVPMPSSVLHIYC